MLLILIQFLTFQSTPIKSRSSFELCKFYNSYKSFVKQSNISNELLLLKKYYQSQPENYDLYTKIFHELQLENKKICFELRYVNCVSYSSIARIIYCSAGIILYNLYKNYLINFAFFANKICKKRQRLNKLYFNLIKTISAKEKDVVYLFITQFIPEYLVNETSQYTFYKKMNEFYEQNDKFYKTRSNFYDDFFYYKFVSNNKNHLIPFQLFLIRKILISYEFKSIQNTFKELNFFNLYLNNEIKIELFLTNLYIFLSFTFIKSRLITLFLFGKKELLCIKFLPMYKLIILFRLQLNIRMYFNLFIKKCYFFGDKIELIEYCDKLCKISYEKIDLKNKYNEEEKEIINKIINK
ncbi:hypothetical protein TUBRATIS_25670 [Tubulinosema ratisbonensis]|uniref:Uncharacterized protein n=1 Tax=Tubulinosema ratisbonensis TaxID=291195 RepID=A0A437AIV2_9MICR|nr:hypothetical protein TUBRATIS_25670 [Tubulinosema ratisbonensis]